MRGVMLAVTLLFLVGFTTLTIHAALDRGFTILSAISLLVVGLLAIGILGAIWGRPPGE
ncbi:MAG: hypothetical protein LT070_01190 [Solirubrobacteraceae bacterium]|nr:hypothetical protein [Solirubrobacteraceae bacterium]